MNPTIYPGSQADYYNNSPQSWMIQIPYNQKNIVFNLVKKNIYHPEV